MKTFDLSVDERELMCRMLQYCMENNANCNFRSGSWYPPEQGEEQKEMKALHDKLEVRRVTKEGWMLKDLLINVWINEPDVDKGEFQRITWEEVE